MSTFNYTIVGAGAAGLHLALAMLREGLLESRNLLVIEPNAKKTNDKTWCFWEKEHGNWDQIITKSWAKGLVIANNEDIRFDLGDYHYKMLKSIDFYNYAISKLKNHMNITWKEEQVTRLNEIDIHQVEVTTTKQTYETSMVFDSRIDVSFFKPHEYYNINQHFKGWFIETESPQFKEDEFTMMDFSVKDGATTSFTYVLPVNPHQALVEFTYFTPHLVNTEHYDQFLETYLKQRGVTEFKVINEELGNIPMTNFTFDNQPHKSIIKIGTAGGWVKASTGYAFKNCERKSNQIVKLLKANQRLRLKTPFKYKHYDKLFLDVLTHHNGFGETLFYKMYKKNKIETIFKFLDEESSLMEDLSIVLNLTSSPFIKALGKHALSGFKIN